MNLIAFHGYSLGTPKDGANVFLRINDPADFINSQVGRLTFGTGSSVKKNSRDSDTFNVADHNKRLKNKVDADDVFEAPRILRDPNSRQVILGGRLSLRITATGKPLPSYQWFLNGKKIVGATSDRLTINQTRREHCGAFSCEVRNLAGQATSRAAMVSFLPEKIPEIIVEPVVASIPTGNPFKFRIASPGNDALKHFKLQWVFNGKKIKDAIGPELQFTQVKSKYEGEYKVLVLAGGEVHASNCVKLKALPAESAPSVEPALTREKTAFIARPPKEEFFFDPLEEGDEDLPPPGDTGFFLDPVMEPAEEPESAPVAELEPASIPLSEAPPPPEPLRITSLPELPAVPAAPAPLSPLLEKKRVFLQRFLRSWPPAKNPTRKAA